jgi:outer membrane lipoprotein-sorting protein
LAGSFGKTALARYAIIATSACVFCLTAVAKPAVAQSAAAPSSTRASASSGPSANNWSGSLESVLNLMDRTGKDFRSAEATFVWDQYQKVVDETDTQKGKIYFRRVGKEVQMAADISDPANEAKDVLFSGGKVQLYQPQTNQLDVYSTEKNEEEFESFLLLGFGGGGHDMMKSFYIKYLGEEKLPNGTLTAKLGLVPKSDKIRNNFDHFVLWIDARGISVQQQIFSASDYKLAKYSDIKLNEKLPNNSFNLKTNSSTKTVKH